MLRSSLTALALALPVCAQQTYVVDCDQRPGFDFADLPAAVAAAQPGDTLLVRRGSANYAPFTIQKGLSILAEADTPIATIRFSPTITISNLPAHETLRIEGFLGQAQNPLAVVATGNQGRIVLSRMRGLEPCNCGPGVLITPGFSFTDCDQVVLDQCENFGRPALECVRSRVVASRSRFGLTSLGLAIGDSLHVDGGHVEIVDSVMDASNGMDTAGNAVPAVRLTAGTLRIAGSRDALVQGSQIFGTFSLQPAIDASGGTLELDLDVQLNPFAGGGVPLALHGAALVLRQFPVALVRASDIGGTLDAELIASAQATAALLLGLPVTPIDVAPFGTAWLDPAASAVLAAGSTGASGVLGVSIPLPVGLPTGLVFCVQAACDLGGGPELSTPAIAALR